MALLSYERMLVVVEEILIKLGLARLVIRVFSNRQVTAVECKVTKAYLVGVEGFHIYAWN